MGFHGSHPGNFGMYTPVSPCFVILPAWGNPQLAPPEATASPRAAPSLSSNWERRAELQRPRRLLR